jgi:hypothetical protein
MAQIFESLMIIFFGISWPVNIIKSYRARTTKGKSVLFLFLVLAGYYFGIIAKIAGNQINYVLIFYLINSFMVKVDIFMYVRNSAIDRENGLIK